MAGGNVVVTVPEATRREAQSFRPLGYSPIERFGLTAVDDGREEGFVHAAVLRPSGVPSLSEGERVERDLAEGRKGLEAASLSLR
jgi:cold shock CspA family protein